MSARVTKADRELSVVKGLEDEVLLQRHRLETIGRMLPDDAEINDFVEQLTRFAAASKVQITELDDSMARQRSTRKGAAREAFARVTYHLKLAADMEGLLHFLDCFENRYARFVTFPSLSIESGSGAGDKEVKPHTVDLTLETYVYTPRTPDAGDVEIAGGAERMQQLVLERKPSVNAASFERYAYQGSTARRDPFRDPAPVPAAVEASAAQPAESDSKPSASATVAASAVAEDAVAKAAAAQARRDAERTAALANKKLDISGAIVAAENAGQSIALINGRGYCVGESVDGVLVRAVRATTVEFEFDGLIFERPIGAPIKPPEREGK
jgi:Tfp pilus assembly protein PilO